MTSHRHRHPYCDRRASGSTSVAAASATSAKLKRRVQPALGRLECSQQVLPNGNFRVTFLDFGNQDECTKQMIQAKGKYGKKRSAGAISKPDAELEKLLNKDKIKATELYDGKYNARRPKVRYDVMDADAPDPRLGGHHGVSDRS